MRYADIIVFVLMFLCIFTVGFFTVYSYAKIKFNNILLNGRRSKKVNIKNKK